MHIDLLRAEPLDAIGDAPGALPRKERRKLDAQLRIGLAALRETVVVMRLGKVDERAVFFRARNRIRQIPLELSAVVGLEDLGIGPVKIGFGEQAVRRLEAAAEALEHEDRVGILLAHLGDNVLPCLGGNHVAGVAPEAVHAKAAPEEEDVRHVGPQFGIRIVELDEIRPGDAPGAGTHEPAVVLTVKPLRMMRLQRRRPARVVCGEVDQHEPVPRVNGADQLLELVKRRRTLVELGHGRIDGKEVGRRERTAVFAHHRVGRRHGERRQRLDDPEAHRVHDEREPPDDLAKRAELPRKDAVDRVARARLAALDLDVRVAALGPLGHMRPLGKEAGLAGEDADFVQADVRPEKPRRHFLERNVRPRLRERRQALLGLVDNLAAADRRVPDVGAKCGATLARRVELQCHGQRVAAPLEEKVFCFWNLRHGKLLAVS